MAFNLFPQTDFRQMDLNYVLEVSKQAAANLEEYAADKEQVVATQAAAEEALAAAQQDIQTATQAAASAGQDAQTATQAAGTATRAAENASHDAQTASAAAQTAQQVQESIPADYTQLSNDVDALKSDLNEVLVKTANLYNPATVRHDATIDTSNGTIIPSDVYKISDYIKVGANNKITVQIVVGLVSRVYFFRSADSSGYSRALWVQVDTGSETYTLAPDEEYVIIQTRENCPDIMANLGDTLLPFAPYGYTEGDFLQGVMDEVDGKIADVRESSAQKSIINRFDTSITNEGKYINVSNGDLATADGFFASDFIYIGDLDRITLSYTHLFVWYDENKAHLTPNPETMDSVSSDLTFTRPENVSYLRFSTYNRYKDLAQVGTNVSRVDYTPFGLYSLPDLRVTQTQIKNVKQKIVIDVSGNGDYTSFTQGIYETVDSGMDVVVKPGTYDIVSEYVALFGQNAVDSMADDDSSVFNGFQYGVILRNRKIVFTPGCHVVCDWTGHVVNATRRFSAIRVDYDVEIVGLNLDATATFYAIHDDYGLNTPYSVKYENCRIIGHNLYNANCIGGGCKRYSRHVLNNCYFDNELLGSSTVRYHNTNAEGAEPEVYVSNCYFNNWFTPRWYGAQTSKMKVYVNNCEARAIYKAAESSSFDVDNVELYKWCNTETNPVT